MHIIMKISVFCWDRCTTACILLNWWNSLEQYCLLQKIINSNLYLKVIQFIPCMFSKYKWMQCRMYLHHHHHHQQQHNITEKVIFNYWLNSQRNLHHIFTANYENMMKSILLCYPEQFIYWNVYLIVKSYVWNKNNNEIINYCWT